MDFGINGKRTIVCARSKGLGKACAMALAGECVNGVTTVARRKEALEAVAREIRNPGVIATDTRKSRMAMMAKQSGKTMDEIASQRMSSIPAGRFGGTLAFGQLCAYICSAQASYITGQNFLIDGGSYPGTL